MAGQGRQVQPLKVILGDGVLLEQVRPQDPAVNLVQEELVVGLEPRLVLRAELSQLTVGAPA